MSEMAYETEIRGYLKSRFPRYDDKLGADASLDRIVDSLAVFDLVEWVEKSFQIRIPNEEFTPQRFASIRAICETITHFR